MQKLLIPRLIKNNFLKTFHFLSWCFGIRYCSSCFINMSYPFLFVGMQTRRFSQDRDDMSCSLSTLCNEINAPHFIAVVLSHHIISYLLSLTPVAATALMLLAGPVRAAHRLQRLSVQLQPPICAVKRSRII